MNQPMFLAVALALCALPCALGISCYHCEPDLAMGKLCNFQNNLTSDSCSHPNASCYMTKIMTSLSNAAEAYKFGCSNDTCPDQNTADCGAVNITVVGLNGTLNMCNTECCMTDNCKSFIMPTTASSMEMSSTAAVNPATTKPADAGSKLYPAFGLLFITLFALV